jgi:hypothetical protein
LGLKRAKQAEESLRSSLDKANAQIATLEGALTNTKLELTSLKAAQMVRCVSYLVFIHFSADGIKLVVLSGC